MSLLYSLIIVVLFWAPAGVVLHGYYTSKYKNITEAEYHLDKTMKSGAPIVAIFIAITIGIKYQIIAITIGVILELVLIYSDEDSIQRYRRFLDND